MEYIENILKNCFGDKIKKYEILDSKNFNIDNYKNNLIKNKNHKIFYDFALKSWKREITNIWFTQSILQKIQKCFNLMEEYENKHNLINMI